MKIIGTTMENSMSEYDAQVPSISDYSIELTKLGHSNSNYSVQSLKSVTSLESHGEDDTSEFMRRFVELLFTDSSEITQELKSDFGNKSQVRRPATKTIQIFFTPSELKFCSKNFNRWKVGDFGLHDM